MALKRAVILLLLLTVSCAPAAAPVPYLVVTHPDGPQYVGDQVSFEIITPPGEISSDLVTISFEGEALGTVAFAPYGIGQRSQATFWWVWDTSSLDPGKYALTITLASGISWEQRIRLRPVNQVPPPEPEAAWASTTSECCILHYITGTDAERDIISLATLADEEARVVASQLDATLPERINIIFIPRVIGHGGFAWNGVYVSYLDDSYLGNDGMAIILHHEFVHYYDDRIGSEYQPSMLQEGLAVYLSGGHFKPEAIMPRAAAMLAMGEFLPLETLANDFYHQQHDLGYLEAAAVIEYLFETYGPGGFIEFYRTIPPPQGRPDSEVINAALESNFSVSLSEVETGLLEALATQTVTPEVREDLELTVATYDAVRRYQALFDPSAYFLTAWLPDGLVMREKGIVADFTRRPQAWQNRLLEEMLEETHRDLFGGEPGAARGEIKWLNRVMDVLAP